MKPKSKIKTVKRKIRKTRRKATIIKHSHTFDRLKAEILAAIIFAGCIGFLFCQF
jgi:uncharacterized protein YbcC (UPF0753/DUF2309 family)